MTLTSKKVWKRRKQCHLVYVCLLLLFQVYLWDTSKSILNNSVKKYIYLPYLSVHLQTFFAKHQSAYFHDIVFHQKLYFSWHNLTIHFDLCNHTECTIFVYTRGKNLHALCTMTYFPLYSTTEYVNPIYLSIDLPIHRKVCKKVLTSFFGYHFYVFLQSYCYIILIKVH